MFEVSSVIKKEPLNSQPKNAKSSDFKRFIYVRRSKHHVSTDLNRNYFKRKTIAFFKTPLQWFDAQFDMQTWKENNNNQPPTGDWSQPWKLAKDTDTTFLGHQHLRAWICWVWVILMYGFGIWWGSSPWKETPFGSFSYFFQCKCKLDNKVLSTRMVTFVLVLIFWDG